MQRSDLRNVFYDLRREKSTNTSITTTLLNRWLNLAYQQMVEEIWPDFINTKERKVIPSTTYTSGTGTSIVLASVTNVAANTDLVVYSGSRYDQLRIISIDVPTRTLTLESPGLLYTHAGGSTAIPMSVTISNPKMLSNVNWETNTAVVRTSSEIKPTTDEAMFRLADFCGSTGVPSRYCLFGETEMKLYPVPNSAGFVHVYYKGKTEYSFSEDSSEALFDEPTQLGLVYWCMKIAQLRDRDWNGALFYKTLYEELINRAKTLDAKKKELNQPFDFRSTMLDE